MKEAELPTVRYSTLAENSAAMASAWAEDLPALTAEAEEKAVKELKQASVLDYFKKSPIISTEEILEDANQTPVPEVDGAESSAGDMQWVPTSHALPLASYEETVLLDSDDEDSSDESDASCLSSPLLRSTTPDSEVSSATSSEYLVATKPEFPVAEDGLDLCEAIQTLHLEEESDDHGTGSRIGGLSGNGDTTNPVGNLQRVSAGDTNHGLDASRSGSAAVCDVVKDVEDHQSRPTEDEVTFDDQESLIEGGNDAASDEHIPTSAAEEAAHLSATTESKLESVIDDNSDEGTSILLEEVEVSGPSTVVEPEYRYDGNDGGQFPDDLQSEADANNHNAGTTQSESAPVEGDMIGDGGIPEAFRKENKAEAHEPASEVDASQSAGAGILESNFAAVVGAIHTTDQSAQDSLIRDDGADDIVQDAASSNGDTARLNPLAQDIGSFSTGIASSELEDAAPTYTAASSFPLQAASAAPAASTVVPVGPSQVQSSPPITGIDMSGAYDAESLLQAKQPSAQQSLPQVHVVSSFSVSDQSSTADDVDMAFAEMFDILQTLLSTETNSNDAMDVVAADDSGFSPASIILPGTTLAPGALSESQEALLPISAPVSSQLELSTAATQAASFAPAAPIMPPAATTSTQASTSAPNVNMSGTHGDISSSGSMAQDMVQGGTADATSAAAQESSQIDDVQSSSGTTSPDVPSLAAQATDQGDVTNPTPAAAEENSEMNDVQSSLDTSSPGVPPSAPKLDPSPAKVPGDHPIWSELSDLGPKLLGYLKTEIKRRSTLNLPSNVVGYIRTAKASPSASHLLITLLKAAPSVTLLQLVTRRDRVVQARPRGAAAQVAPAVVSAQPQPAVPASVPTVLAVTLASSTAMPTPTATSPSGPPSQSTTTSAAGAWVLSTFPATGNPPTSTQAHNALSGNTTLAVATPPVTQEEDVNLEMSYVIGQLRRARFYIANVPWAVNFNHMFDLPFNNEALMTKLAKCIIDHGDWGNGDIKKAGNKISAAFQGGGFSIPILIWTCCIFLHKTNLQPVAVSAIKRGAKSSYQDQRVKTVRSLFETIARSQYFNITTGLFTQCMPWKEMKELAANEEIDWLGPRFLSILSKEQRHYDKHMQERKDFWGDIANMRRHLKALYPDPTLQSFLADDPESDPTAPTGSKRSAGCTQTAAAKRAKPLADAVPPPPPPLYRTLAAVGATMVCTLPLDVLQPVLNLSQKMRSLSRLPPNVDTTNETINIATS